MADISQVKLPDNTTYDLSVKAEKIKSGYLENRIYLNMHPENSGSAVLPFLYNDLAFLTKRGGSIDAYLTTATTYTAATLSNRTEYAINSPESMFDGSPSYASNIVRTGTSATDIRVIDLTLHKIFAYSNIFYIDFGAVSWKATKITVLVKNADTETNYVKKIETTNNALGHWYGSINHSSTNTSGTTVQGFNRMRIVISGFDDGRPTGNTRIAQIGLINYGSFGAKETFISRGGCAGIYGNLVPYNNKDISLGNSGKYWAHAYIDKGHFTNTLSLYREGTTAQDLPAGIDFTVKDTTTGQSFSNTHIRAFQDHAATSNGANLVVSPGGNLFIGSGEAPDNHYDAIGKNSTGESTYITADGVVVIQANANTIANRAGVRVTTNGELVPEKADKSTNNIGGIGTSSYKWANGYFTNINGVAVGDSPKFTDTTYTAGTGLTLVSNKFYNKGAEFIYGTQTASTNAWTGVTTDPELYDGKEIIYFLPFAGTTTSTTLDLTLAGGTTTGAKNVYFNSTTRHTNHYGQYQMIRMVYHSSLTINGTAYSGWWIDYARDLNDTAQFLKATGVIYKSATALYRYQICLEVDDTTLVPINAVNNSTATTKTLTTSSFRPFGRIFYYNNTNTVNANATIPDGRLQFNTTLDLRYSFNTGTTLTAQKAVYMVCTPQSDGRAKLYSSPITQTLPSTDDGRYYIYLGSAYSTYNLQLSASHPVYMYKNGAVREISQYAEHAGSSSYDSSTETLTINL